MAENERMARLEEQIKAIDRLMVEKLRGVADLAEKHNDLIRQMQEKDKTYLNKEEYSIRHENLARLGDVTKEELRNLESRVATIEGGNLVRASTAVVAIGALGLFLTVVVILVNLLTSGAI